MRWIFVNSSVSANDFLFFCLETWSRRRITEERWSYERKQTTKNYCYSSKDSVIKLTLFYSNFLLFYKIEKKSQRAIKRKENTLKSPWELRVKISKPSKARENAGDQVVIGVSFAFDWLREWREFSGPITEQSKVNEMQSRITLDTQLKISPLGLRLCPLYQISRKRTPRQIQRLRVQRQKIPTPVQQRKCQFKESNLGIPRHLHKLSRHPRKQRKGLLATISWDEGGALKVWVMNPSQGHEWSTSPAEGNISCIVENALVNNTCMSL